MTLALAEAACARLPAGELRRLGLLRAREDVRAALDGERLWLYWPAPNPELAAWLLSLPGVELFRRGRDGWCGLNRSLPIFDVPDPQTGKMLAALIFPAAVEPFTPGVAPWRPVEVRLVRDDQPRPASALLLPLAELIARAETATSHALAALTGARRGDVVLLRGTLPPWTGERFWGTHVLAPAGWRPEPALSEGILARALHLGEEDVALLTSDGADVLPAGSFGPVTRAGLRLTLEDASHAG